MAGVRLFFDEQRTHAPGGRAAVRLLVCALKVEGGVRIFENLATGSKVPLSDFDTLRLAQRWPTFRRDAD
jgi:hypothetical protein